MWCKCVCRCLDTPPVLPSLPSTLIGTRFKQTMAVCTFKTWTRCVRVSRRLSVAVIRDMHGHIMGWNVHRRYFKWITGCLARADGWAACSLTWYCSTFRIHPFPRGHGGLEVKVDSGEQRDLFIYLLRDCTSQRISNLTRIFFCSMLIPQPTCCALLCNLYATDSALRLMTRPLGRVE